MELNFLPLTPNQELALGALARGEKPEWLTGQLTGPLRRFGLVSDANAVTQLGNVALRTVQSHRLITGRKQLGRGAVKGSGMTYGTTASCTCGAWKSSVNQAASRGGTKVMRTQHASHVASHVEAELASADDAAGAVEYVVVFTNENYAGSGLGMTARVTVPVDFGEPVTRDNLEEYVEQLLYFATQVWDEVDWTLDEPGWEPVSVELPNGEVVDL